MKQDRELTYDVYLGDYQVTPESSADVIDYIGDGVCPMCKSDSHIFSEMPEPGNTTLFVCSECEAEITVEAWWVK